METETSQFESSEMLATYLASTPLLEESWRQCSRANAAAPQSFLVHRVGSVAYVAFSGVQLVDCSEESCRKPVEMERYDDGVFGGFSALGGDADREPIMVHGGLLQLFLMFFHTESFQHKVLEMVNECKSVVCCGHSLGGSLASLTALWLLSTIQTPSHPIQVLCITFGSPMLGNQSFSQAILQERWGGNFCHVVGQHDIVPRMLFAPATPIMHELGTLFEFWQLSMGPPSPAPGLPYGDIVRVFELVLACAERRFREVQDQDFQGSLFWPFGSYLFCSDEGAICMDNRVAIVKLLYLMMLKGSAVSFVEDHLKYGSFINRISWQFLRGRNLTNVAFSNSSSEAGISLALHSARIGFQEVIYGAAKNCLAMARNTGNKRNLNNAKMAVSLARVNPLRAQIEWYKKFCEDSDDQLGYYDAFKMRGNSKRGSRPNLNRVRLGHFWDEVINMLETNQLTHDFHKIVKYVNASHFYTLLVEPLEIAEYYRTCMHKKKGHYIEHGREKRFKVFDKWWRERRVGEEESNPRSRFASLTQDPCFWARVEEARDCMFQIERGLVRESVLLDKIVEFEKYALGMVERKEVSIDVLAKNSSYSLFREEWKELKTRMQRMQPRFQGAQDATMQDMYIEAENSCLLRLS